MIMRDFNRFQVFCHTHKNKYEYLAFKGAFERVESYTDYNREGHYMQLFYAIYEFFTQHPEFISRAGVPAFEISKDGAFFDAWDEFIHDDGNDADGFMTESLRKNLSPACAGHREGGGGWSPIAKILFPMVAVYMEQ